MFYQYQQTEKPETLEVCGIPFLFRETNAA